MLHAQGIYVLLLYSYSYKEPEHNQKVGSPEAKESNKKQRCCSRAVQCTLNTSTSTPLPAAAVIFIFAWKPGYKGADTKALTYSNDSSILILQRMMVPGTHDSSPLLLLQDTPYYASTLNEVMYEVYNKGSYFSMVRNWYRPEPFTGNAPNRSFGPRKRPKCVCTRPRNLYTSQLLQASKYHYCRCIYTSASSEEN